MSTRSWMRRVGAAVAVGSVLATLAQGSSATAASTGLLRVTSSPAVPTQILVDGQIADSWGLTWLKLAPGSLLPAELIQELRSHWDHVQTGFVDEPRQGHARRPRSIGTAPAAGFSGF